MREILFRGKRLDNGEWVEGYLYITHNGEHEIGCYNADVNIERWTFVVDPTTIGQYTGLKDKNGRRIFEGDIVHCIARMDQANCVVIFEEGEFRLVPERDYKTYVTGCGFHALRCFEKEIIGNIRDNPELRKGGEGDG